MEVTEDEENTTRTTETITLTIVPETITLDSPANMPTTWAYTVGDGVDTLSFDDYICNIDCGIKSYQAYIQSQFDFAPLSSYLSFNSGSKTLTLSNLNTNNLTNTYTIEIRGEEDEATTINTSATITLTVSPITITLNPPSNMPTTWAYTVGNGGSTLIFDPFTCNVDCGTISYVAYIGSEGSFGALDTLLSFNPTSRTLTLDTSTSNL